MTDQTDYLKCADVLLSGHYRDVTTKDIALSSAYALIDIAQTLRTMREDALRIGMNLTQVAGKLTSDDGIGVGDLLADIAARPEIKIITRADVDERHLQEVARLVREEAQTPVSSPALAQDEPAAPSEGDRAKNSPGGRVGRLIGYGAAYPIDAGEGSSGFRMSGAFFATREGAVRARVKPSDLIVAVYEDLVGEAARQDPGLYRQDVRGIAHPIAEHMAAASPDIVLALIARIRELEGADHD